MSENTGGMKVRYRIKTEEEFIEEYGEGWRNEVNWSVSTSMDYLFGREVETNIKHKVDAWTIWPDMITEITAFKPSKNHIRSSTNENR